MKVIRVIVTILLAFFLFPTMFIALQGALYYDTLYNSTFTEDVIDDYNLSEKITEIFSSVVTDQIEQMQTNLPVGIDVKDLNRTITKQLEDKDLSDAIDDLILGMHSYYFTDEKDLPVISIDFLNDILSESMTTFSNQMIGSNGLINITDITNALEAGYDSGLINESSIDTTLDYLRNNDIGVDNIDNTLLIEFIETYEEKYLDTPATEEELEATFNEVVLGEYLDTPLLPKKLDIEDIAKTIYGDKENPITEAKTFTFLIPKNLAFILLALLLCLPLIYLVIHRFNIFSTLQFISITGLVASVFSLITVAILYWFSPAKIITNQFEKVGDLAGGDLAVSDIIGEFLDFFGHLTNQFFGRGIKLNLIALIIFILLLILTEVKKKFYPPKETLDSSLAITLQLLGSLAVTILLIFLIRYEVILIIDHVSDYNDVVAEFKDMSAPLDNDQLFDALMEQ